MMELITWGTVAHMHTKNNYKIQSRSLMEKSDYLRQTTNNNRVR